MIRLNHSKVSGEYAFAMSAVVTSYPVKKLIWVWPVAHGASAAVTDSSAGRKSSAMPGAPTAAANSWKPPLRCPTALGVCGCRASAPPSCRISTISTGVPESGSATSSRASAAFPGNSASSAEIS